METPIENYPDFAVVWSFFNKFGKQLELDEIMITDLIKWLSATANDATGLIDIIVKLMRKIGMRADKQRWQKHLAKALAKQDIELAAELQTLTFFKLQPTKKLQIFKLLCEMQFDDNMKFKNLINSEESDEQRLKPVGKDEDGLVYWHQEDNDMNIRLYVEDEDEEDDSGWKVICRNLDDIGDLITQLTNEPLVKKPATESDEEDGGIESKFQKFLKNQCTTEAEEDHEKANKDKDETKKPAIKQEDKEIKQEKESLPQPSHLILKEEDGKKSEDSQKIKQEEDKNVSSPIKKEPMDESEKMEDSQKNIKEEDENSKYKVKEEPVDESEEKMEDSQKNIEVDGKNIGGGSPIDIKDDFVQMEVENTIDYLLNNIKTEVEIKSDEIASPSVNMNIKESHLSPISETKIEVKSEPESCPQPENTSKMETETLTDKGISTEENCNRKSSDRDLVKSPEKAESNEKETPELKEPEGTNKDLVSLSATSKDAVVSQTVSVIKSAMLGNNSTTLEAQNHEVVQSDHSVLDSGNLEHTTEKAEVASAENQKEESKESVCHDEICEKDFERLSDSEHANNFLSSNDNQKPENSSFTSQPSVISSDILLLKSKADSTTDAFDKPHIVVNDVAVRESSADAKPCDETSIHQGTVTDIVPEIPDVAMTDVSATDVPQTQDVVSEDLQKLQETACNVVSKDNAVSNSSQSVGPQEKDNLSQTEASATHMLPDNAMDEVRNIVQTDEIEKKDDKKSESSVAESSSTNDMSQIKDVAMVETSQTESSTMPNATINVAQTELGAMPQEKDTATGGVPQTEGDEPGAVPQIKGNESTVTPEVSSSNSSVSVDLPQTESTVVGSIPLKVDDAYDGKQTGEDVAANISSMETEATALVTDPQTGDNTSKSISPIKDSTMSDELKTEGTTIVHAEHSEKTSAHGVPPRDSAADMSQSANSITSNLIPSKTDDTSAVTQAKEDVIADVSEIETLSQTDVPDSGGNVISKASPVEDTALTDVPVSEDNVTSVVPQIKDDATKHLDQTETTCSGDLPPTSSDGTNDVCKNESVASENALQDEDVKVQTPQDESSVANDNELNNDVAPNTSQTQDDSKLSIPINSQVSQVKDGDMDNVTQAEILPDVPTKDTTPTSRPNDASSDSIAVEDKISGRDPPSSSSGVFSNNNQMSEDVCNAHTSSSDSAVTATVNTKSSSLADVPQTESSATGTVTDACANVVEPHDVTDKVLQVEGNTMGVPAKNEGNAANFTKPSNEVEANDSSQCDAEERNEGTVVVPAEDIVKRNVPQSEGADKTINDESNTDKSPVEKTQTEDSAVSDSMPNDRMNKTSETVTMPHIQTSASNNILEKEESAMPVLPIRDSTAMTKTNETANADATRPKMVATPPPTSVTEKNISSNILPSQTPDKMPEKIDKKTDDHSESVEDVTANLSTSVSVNAGVESHISNKIETPNTESVETTSNECTLAQTSKIPDSPKNSKLPEISSEVSLCHAVVDETRDKDMNKVNIHDKNELEQNVSDCKVAEDLIGTTNATTNTNSSQDTEGEKTDTLNGVEEEGEEEVEGKEKQDEEENEENKENDNDAEKSTPARKRGRRKRRGKAKRKPQPARPKQNTNSNTQTSKPKRKMTELDKLKADAEFILHNKKKDSNAAGGVGDAYRTRSGRRVKSAKKEEPQVWQTVAEDDDVSAKAKRKNSLEEDEDFQYVAPKKRNGTAAIREYTVREIKRRLVEDDTPCMKCGLFSHPETILLCDGCNKGHHMACLAPPLMLVPEDDWFCPKCSQEKLIKRLHEIYDELGNKLKLHQRKVKQNEYKKLLNEYTGISATNIITAEKPAKPKPPPKKRKMSTSSESDLEDLLQDSYSSPSSPEIKTRRCRTKVSYDFSTFDKTIMDAIKSDIDAKSEVEKERPVSGKDIRTIIAAEKGDTVDLLDEEEEEKNKISGKRKRRKLSNLNSSEDEEADSGSNYSLSSNEEMSEEEFLDEEISESDSLSGGRFGRRRRNGRGRRVPYVKPIKRSRRLRKKRIQEDYETSFSESSSDYEETAPKKKATQKRNRYGRESSDTDEYVPSKIARTRHSIDDVKEKSRKHRRRVVLHSSSSDEDGEKDKKEKPKPNKKAKADGGASSNDSHEWSSLSSGARSSDHDSTSEEEASSEKKEKDSVQKNEVT